MASSPTDSAAASNSTSVAFELIERFRKLLGPERVLASDDELLVYECDGYVVENKSPDVV